MVRPESREAIEALHEDRIEVVMLTGDSRAVAEAVAQDLGIDKVFAEVLPDQKWTGSRIFSGPESGLPWLETA